MHDNSVPPCCENSQTIVIRTRFVGSSALDHSARRERDVAFDIPLPKRREIQSEPRFEVTPSWAKVDKLTVWCLSVMA